VYGASSAMMISGREARLTSRTIPIQLTRKRSQMNDECCRQHGCAVYTRVVTESRHLRWCRQMTQSREIINRSSRVGPDCGGQSCNEVQAASASFSTANCMTSPETDAHVRLSHAGRITSNYPNQRRKQVPGAATTATARCEGDDPLFRQLTRTTFALTVSMH